MFTYLAINLTNKKFQVGSTTNFEKRRREHHSGKGNLAFQRSLRRDPKNFFWFCSVDDGLDTRDEEQFYLDFYCGTKWCYNHNPSAVQPPSPLGKRLTQGQKEAISKANTGRKRPDLAERNRREVRRGPDHPSWGKPNLLCSRRNLENNPAKGKHWYTNEDRTEELLAVAPPGSTWKPGRKKKL